MQGHDEAAVLLLSRFILILYNKLSNLLFESKSIYLTQIGMLFQFVKIGFLEIGITNDSTTFFTPESGFNQYQPEVLADGKEAAKQKNISFL